MSLCCCLYLQISNGFFKPGLATFLRNALLKSVAPTSIMYYMLFFSSIDKNNKVTLF